MDKNKRWSIFTCLLLTLLSVSLTAQVKFEREYRIKPVDVPKTAVSFVDSAFRDIPVRWYMETSSEGKSIEAKLMRNRTLYSIEFDESGNLEDVEFEISAGDLPEKTLDAIRKWLGNRFSSYRMMKIQQQWTGSRYELFGILTGKMDPDEYPARYEIMVRGRISGKTVWYEYLFSDSGEMLSEIPVVFKNTDNLVY